MPASGASIVDRVITLGHNLAAIPERLLLAHARGEVLFICGAGVSKPAGLPDFRELVLQVYEELDLPVHAVLKDIPSKACSHWEVNALELDARQSAEVRRFISGDYDVVLGMLERRLDDQGHGGSRVRRVVAAKLREPARSPAPIHKALVRLSDRGAASSIITTNFDRLLEQAAANVGRRMLSQSLGAIPRPTRREEFSGVHHIHGAISPKPSDLCEFVLTDQDFGEFYLRRRVIPDLIYDAVRLFHIVLVGYSANDPPMRYLLNAVAADGYRFKDLKERFTFQGVSAPDAAAIEDWKARGITPIAYDARDGHVALRDTLHQWADLSAINGKRKLLDAEIRRIAKIPSGTAGDADRDLFEHLFRRSDPNEQSRLAFLASSVGADVGWLSVIRRVCGERTAERRYEA